jgi:predicted dehydrogenase
MPKGNRRVGIIGVGFGALVHMPGFRSEGWDVVAICSRSKEKARQAAEANGIPAVHTNALELIGRDDIDAVAIATPPGPHHELSIAVLMAGKHVLCEKPFATNARQAAEMQDTAAKSGRTAMIAHEFRHTPQRAYIKQLLGEGYIGRFHLCTMELFMDRYLSPAPRPFTWNARRAEGGGLLGGLGSHYIDGLRHWFGDVATVSGRVATFQPDMLDQATGKPVKSETDDTFSFILTFKNGGIATMTASFVVTPTRDTRITVMGSEGTLYAEQPGPNPMEDGVVFGGRGGSKLEALKTPPKFLPFSDARDHRLMAFRLLVRDFNRGIDEGTSPAPNFTDGLRCQEVMDAVRESSETGRTITLG